MAGWTAGLSHCITHIYIYPHLYHYQRHITHDNTIHIFSMIKHSPGMYIWVYKGLLPFLFIRVKLQQNSFLLDGVCQCQSEKNCEYRPNHRHKPPELSTNPAPTLHACIPLTNTVLCDFLTSQLYIYFFAIF